MDRDGDGGTRPGCDLDLGSSGRGERGERSDQENLAAQVDGYETTADNISNKKLKKALLSLSDIYSEASEAKNTAGAGEVLAKRAKESAKAFKVHAKALNQCLIRSVPKG